MKKEEIKEENTNCVILKKKEYQELLERANTNSPVIEIELDKSFNTTHTYYSGGTFHSVVLKNEVTSTINLSEPLKKQIQNIIDLFNQSLNKKFEKYKEENFDKKFEEYKEEIERYERTKTLEELANMSFFERMKLLKQYK